MVMESPRLSTPPAQACGVCFCAGRNSTEHVTGAVLQVNKAVGASTVPAGEMWSVVMESPRLSRQKASLMALPRGVLGHALEEGGLVDVRGLGVPRSTAPSGAARLFQSPLPWVMDSVGGAEELREDGFSTTDASLGGGGPDVRQEHGLAAAAGADGLC